MIDLDDELAALQHGYLLVTTRVAALCMKCGSLVLDPDAHTRWHEEQK